MQLKHERLENLLRRPGGKLPAGLRARTLRRLRLKPAPQPWFARPWVWAPALASAFAMLWILQPSPTALNAPLEPSATTSKERNEELAYARRHPGMPGPTTSMQVMQARALMKVEDEAQAALHQDLAAAVGVQADLQPVVTVSVNHVSPEQQAAPGSSNGTELRGWDVGAARSEAGKYQRQPYRLTVKGNRVRPAMGERVRLELVSPEAGLVRIRLFDGQSRLLRVLAELNDPSGPIVIDWDGRLENGREAASGAYVIVVETPKKTEKVGVLVIR